MIDIKYSRQHDGQAHPHPSWVRKRRSKAGQVRNQRLAHDHKNYKEQIFDTFAPYARTAILNAIEKERNNEEQDRHLLQEAVEVFVQMGYNYNSKKLAVYTGELEKYIIENAGVYYQRKSREWMDQDSTPIYLDKVEKVLASETARVAAYLNRSTQEPLAKECYVQLLKTHQKELLRKKTGLFHEWRAQSRTLEGMPRCGARWPAAAC